MDVPEKKPVKVGVKVGGGPPPGYLWNVAILNVAYHEAMTVLSEVQYEHVAAQIRELAKQGDPTHSDGIDVRPIEDFHELRDKGGILAKINIRVFFFLHKESRTIAILGAMNKKNDGATPLGDRRRMKRRMRILLKTDKW